MRLLAAVALLLAQASFAEPSAQLENIVEPRPYGHVLGDLLERRVEVRVPDSAQLVPASLPKPGRVNRFIELRDVSESAGADGEGRALRLRYQVMGVAEQIGFAELPACAPRYVVDGREVAIAVPALAITVGPVSRAGGGEAPLGDVPAQTVDTAPARRQAIIGALLALLLAAPWWAWRYLLPRLAPRRRPFAEAYRLLRRLPVQADAAALLKTLHQGFNASFGATLLPGALPEFFARQPEFRHAEDEIRTFFGASQAHLYGGRPWGEGTMERAQLVRLGRRLRDIERRARG